MDVGQFFFKICPIERSMGMWETNLGEIKWVGMGESLIDEADLVEEVGGLCWGCGWIGCCMYC